MAVLVPVLLAAVVIVMTVVMGVAQDRCAHHGDHQASYQVPASP